MQYSPERRHAPSTGQAMVRGAWLNEPARSPGRRTKRLAELQKTPDAAMPDCRRDGSRAATRTLRDIVDRRCAPRWPSCRRCSARRGRTREGYAIGAASSKVSGREPATGDASELRRSTLEPGAMCTRRGPTHIGNAQSSAAPDAGLGRQRAGSRLNTARAKHAPLTSL